jgi:hypothetical protein
MNKNGEWRAVQTSKEGALCAPSRSSAHMRASQVKKIRELRQALIDAGFVSLDQQATALGLPRSTTWAVLKGNHKCSGLRAGLITRMLGSPKLPAAAKSILADYVSEKIRGAYGHNASTRKRFIAQLEKSGFPRANIRALQSTGATPASKLD